MAHTRRFAASASLIAALSMAATPVAAADFPMTQAGNQYADANAVVGVFDADDVNVDRYRPYRYRRYHRHRRGVDAGDVLAGVLIIGGIAAIASAASNNDRDRRYRDRRYREREYRTRDYDYRSRDYDYRDRRRDSRYEGGSRGLDGAVERCISRIERDVRVDQVDNVSRSGDGWYVTGRLYNGEGFTCRIGSDGQVSNVDYGNVSAASNRQHSDDRYRTAWAEVDRQQSTQSRTDEPRPAYPGGPLPGEEEDDGRYSTAD